ncbi:hypothetical protein ALNOE001_19070 [Candidatus Methanobinarius endosymbioticus]|uniref:Uncharacterized protein n=1 Tax=Candidatus Methanobinarius endosymbioticus TaxID=2006182 RepID=A0A366M8J7_9EURY|nr:hypothetical protein ALNOE001_19070 [Candidatus Methanobinarius endosymbioticus]
MNNTEDDNQKPNKPGKSNPVNPNDPEKEPKSNLTINNKTENNNVLKNVEAKMKKLEFQF